eukprot:6181647-Pleurochrysis_carterae.AAC.4
MRRDVEREKAGSRRTGGYKHTSGTGNDEGTESVWHKSINVCNVSHQSVAVVSSAPPPNAAPFTAQTEIIGSCAEGFKRIIQGGRDQAGTHISAAFSALVAITVSAVESANADSTLAEKQHRSPDPSAVARAQTTARLLSARGCGVQWLRPGRRSRAVARSTAAR